MEDLAPVVLFVYNRPKHTKETVTALAKNYLAKETKLFIYSDGPKNDKEISSVEEVRKVCRGIKGFKEVNIYEKKENCGLADSITAGVTRLVREYGKIIVVEDDLITSKDFIEYMNKALIKYKERADIWSISGYNFPLKNIGFYKYDVYLSLRTSSWGWGTWQDRWERAKWDISLDDDFFKDKQAQKEFNRGGEDLTKMLKRQLKGEINSWAIRWNFSQFLNESYCLYPIKSKVQNIGMDNSGTHFDRKITKFDTQLHEGSLNLIGEIEPNIKMIRKVEKFLRKPLLKKLIRWVLLKLGIYSLVNKVLFK